MKRRVILEYLKDVDEKNILEVGCGCGDLLHVLERRGFTGIGIDISKEALVLAVAGLGSSSGFRLACSTPDQLVEKFDVVIASEVLEHHHDDIQFLRQLHERLQDRGMLLLTVPAHQKQWGANDDFCGHIRRYERQELIEKLQTAGFEEIKIFSYGVPVYNLMKPLYDWMIGSKNAQPEQVEKTANSGGMWLVQWGGRIFRCLFNDITLYPFYILQKLFYHTDLGMGYFAAARKKEQKL
jgi:SAM-dependent methyltransferase